jgi:thiamine kinase-like enzyme
MNLSLQENKSLFSQKIMNSFFKRKCKIYFGADELVYLKIFPKKTLSKNILILYELSLLKKGKKFSKNIWGKTIKKNQFQLLKFLAGTKVGKYIPNYFGYLPSLKFAFSEDIKGKQVRVFEKKFSFWDKNISKIGQLLAEFQNKKIPATFLKIHTINEEKKCIQGWLQKIENYSPKEGKKYKKIKNYYIKNLSNKCWLKRYFSFNHFDFQASNIFYIKKTKSLALLDFDLSKKFHPATDLANFWVHFYIMARYHFSQKRVLSLCDKFLQTYLKKTKTKKDFTECFNLLRLRTILDIAQITASVFKKPSEESQKVFNKLNELLKICL